MTRLKRITRLEREVQYVANDLSEWSDEQLTARIVKLADQLDVSDWSPELAHYMKALLEEAQS